MDSLVGCGRGGRLVGSLGPRVGAQSSCGRHHYRHGSLVDKPCPGGGCNGAVSQGFRVSPGSNLLSGVSGGRFGDWHVCVPMDDVRRRSGELQHGRVHAGHVEAGDRLQGGLRVYSKFWMYPANNSALAYPYYGLECKGARYANETIYPAHTFSFGSEDIVPEQYLYMSPSNSCSDQIPGTPEFTLYH